MFNLDSFPGKEKDEVIILFLHRAHIVFFFDILPYILLAFVPLGINYLYQRFSPAALSGQTAAALITVGLSIYYLGILLFLYNTFVDYFLDSWVVTNHRIISIEQKNLFDRVVSEQALYRIQDVTGEEKGFLATIFGYGSIYVQTAATEERFTFLEVPKPFENAKKIEGLVLRDKEMHPNIPS